VQAHPMSRRAGATVEVFTKIMARSATESLWPPKASVAATGSSRDVHLRMT
jgi:hypothetical protein